MNSIHSKTNIISSLMWKIGERAGYQGIQFIVQIILARLLSPEEYGLIAIVMVFILLANVFVQSGFNTALIQKKDSDDVDFSSVFYLSLIVATVLYCIMFFAAPLIAAFYNQPILTQVLRVLSITLIIGVFNSMQNTYVAKHMIFKELFISSIAAALISGVVGIITAYNGFGVWALVIFQLTNQVVVTIILWFQVEWRPQLIFSFERLSTLFSYGSKLLVSALSDKLYRDLRTLIIGRLYSPAMLGFYNRGQQFPQLIVANLNGSIQSVMLPTLSAHQEDRKRVKEITRRAIITSSFIVFPMMAGMASVAENLVSIVLTDKWLPVVPFLKIFCFSFALLPVHTANLQAIIALGRSDIFLKLEIFKKIVGLSILGISLPFGIYAIAIGQLVSDVISSLINAYPNKELLDYSYKEQLIDIIPTLLISIIMGIITSLLNLLSYEAWKILTLQIIIGVLVYLALAKIFKIESFSYLVATIKQIAKTKGDKYHKNI